MDIHVDPIGEQRAVNAIFGEDVSGGPVRSAPPILAQFINDWPGHPDDFVEVALQPPPLFADRSDVDMSGFGFKLRFHRCQIIAGGRLVGHALRMDALYLATLEAYELAWSNHRQRNGG